MSFYTGSIPRTANNDFVTSFTPARRRIDAQHASAPSSIHHVVHSNNNVKRINVNEGPLHRRAPHQNNNTVSLQFRQTSNRSTSHQAAAAPSRTIHTKNGSEFQFRSITKSNKFLSFSQLPTSALEYKPWSSSSPNKSESARSSSSKISQGSSFFILEKQNLRFCVIVMAGCCITFLCVLSIDLKLHPNYTWKWSEERRLHGRKCVMNFFIDKHAKDEYYPDMYAKSRILIQGTPWTKGEMKVITRFISSVAGTFRSKIDLTQHVVFTGTRDGGYLAQKAYEGWPKRGSRHSELHIVVADTDRNSTDGLGYSYLESIERRFEGKKNVHMYDRSGVAGMSKDEEDELESSSSKTVEAFQKMHVRHGVKHNSTSLEDERGIRLPYPDLSQLIQLHKDEEDTSSEVVIPYLQVDGVRMADQFEILMSAVPLFKKKTIIAAGVEHSQDMDVLKLIKFFDSVEYKTFMLGSRQLARIDHLCPEVLYDVLRHPMIAEPANKHRWSKRILKKMGLHRESPRHGNHFSPPFFIAVPRGRLNREEMAIQHAYDLFGGFDGEKEIKTANDRMVS